jgi:hypothetical protein
MKAIAMKATQEDWDSVKDLGIDFAGITNFDKFPYLVTNCGGSIGFITNVDENDKTDYLRTVHETFDRAIFLDALDIVDEKIWKGSELQVMNNDRWIDCHKLELYRLKPINPEVKQLQELADKLGYKIEKL